MNILKISIAIFVFLGSLDKKHRNQWKLHTPRIICLPHFPRSFCSVIDYIDGRVKCKVRTKIKMVSLPLAMGQQFHKARGPTPPNCPIANSKKYIGLPANASIIK